MFPRPHNANQSYLSPEHHTPLAQQKNGEEARLEEKHLLAQGIELVQLRKHFSALELFHHLLSKESTEQDIKTRAQFWTATCYVELYQFDTAQQYITKHLLEKYPRITSILECRVLSQSGKVNRAHQVLSLLVTNTRLSSQDYVTIGRCYQELNDFYAAEATFKKNPQWQLDYITLLALARLYQRVGFFYKAEQHFQMIDNWHQNAEVLLGLAILYDKNALYAKAELIYNKLTKQHTTDFKFITSQILHYLDRGDIRNAELILNHYGTDATNHQQLLMAYARYYEMKQNAQMALQYQTWLTQKKQYRFSEKYQQCRLIKQVAPEKFLSSIEQPLLNFPYYAPFYLLLAEYKNDVGEFTQATEVLIRAVLKLPHQIKIHYALIRQFFALGQASEAKKHYEYYKSLFVNHPLFSQQLYAMLQSHRFIQQWKFDFNINKISTTYVTLKNNIPQLIFDKLNQLSDEYYFLNNVVKKSLTKECYDIKQGLDVIVVLTEEEMRQKNVGTPNKHLPSLYHLNIDEIKLRCFVLNPELSQTIENSFFCRNFTINCLYADKNGLIIDPSNKGLGDQNEKILRTVKAALSTFQNDPVCILRALRYLANGYKPAYDLEHALYHWQPSNDTPSHQLLAYTEYLFNSVNHDLLIDVINQYKLSHRLWGIARLDKNDITPLQKMMKERNDSHISPSSSIDTTPNLSPTPRKTAPIPIRFFVAEDSGFSHQETQKKGQPLPDNGTQHNNSCH